MSSFKILLTEDDESVRELLLDRLQREGYEVIPAGCGKDALRLLDSHVFDAALIDINLPDMTGIEVLEGIRQRDADIDSVMMTGYPELESAVQALRLGAYDYLQKPLEWVSLQHVMRRIVERRYLRAEVHSLRTRLGETPPLGELVGSSTAMQTVKDTIAKVAPTDSVVLIEGESGTGKELIAAAIHRWSARRKGPFVPVNCAAIPAELMESELFGHIKGAFSSATTDSRGLFRTAEGGTLFLDEVGELPLQMQPKLLRVIQERELRAVGSAQVQRVDIRLIAATNQNLSQAVAAGTFRKDLYFRLNVVRIEPPPLRQIKEDIQPLVLHFIRRLNAKFGRQVQSATKEALDALRGYDFPGNVRELENLLERAYALGASTQIDVADLPSLTQGAPAPRPGAESSPEASSSQKLEALERELIVESLQNFGNDKARAAEALGLSERTLYRRLKKLGIG